jgi:DNA-binding GntR family transcriptional regulator
LSAELARLEVAPDLTEQVYRALVDAISDGSLAPGERVTQEEADGMVQDAPGRGVLVTPLDAALIASVYQVRAALDRLAARLAAMHHVRLDPRLLEQGRKAVRGRSVPTMIDADVAFHRAIYAASGNPLIEQSALLHWRHIRRAIGASLTYSAMPESVWDEHEAIALAIAAGDADRAEALIGDHAQRASDNMTRQLAAGGAL